MTGEKVWTLRDLAGAIEDLSLTAGAAVAFGAHFSKGNQAGKGLTGTGKRIGSGKGLTGILGSPAVH